MDATGAVEPAPHYTELRLLGGVPAVIPDLVLGVFMPYLDVRSLISDGSATLSLHSDVGLVVSAGSLTLGLTGLQKIAFGAQSYLRVSQDLVFDRLGTLAADAGVTLTVGASLIMSSGSLVLGQTSLLDIGGGVSSHSSRLSLGYRSMLKHIRTR
jgi:hypothetical protein